MCFHQHQNYCCSCLVQSLALLRGCLFPSPGVPGHVEGNVLSCTGAVEEPARSRGRGQDGNRQTRGRKVQQGGTPVSPNSLLGAGIRVVAPPPAAHATLSSLSLRGPKRQQDQGESCKAAEPPLPDGLCPGQAPPAPQRPWAARPREGTVRPQQGQGKPGGTRVF